MSDTNKMINESDTIDLKYKWTTTSKKNQELNSTILQIIVDQFFKTEPKQIQHEGIELISFTEFSYNNIIYKANLYYKNESPWYDWALVAWSIPHRYTNSQIHKETFSKIILVLNMEGKTTKNDKKALLTPAKLMFLLN